MQLIYKVRSGTSVEDALEDIISRGVGEIRKNAFGDDVDDAKSLPWSREQAWGLMKRFVNHSEVSVGTQALFIFSHSFVDPLP